MYCKQVVTVYFARCDGCDKTSEPKDHAPDVSVSNELRAWDWYTGRCADTFHLCASCLRNPKVKARLDTIIADHTRSDPSTT